MKKILAALTLTFIATAALAQTGTWSGKLDVSGTTLSLVFHIGDSIATLDVPDQGAKQIPVSVKRSAFGSIELEVPSINASYKGLWTGKLITGTYTQNGMSFPLPLTPGAPVLRRPQTPVGPFAYVNADVSFSNGDAVLKGTLTMPENCSRETPVLLMVTGSGFQNRDEAMFGHKPFAVIADAFANAGIATLRYDDRGFGESTGDVVSCTTEDLKNDALAGIGLLRGKFDHVGVLGHSEGGSIALMLAAEGKADFVISLAGMVASGSETLLDQNRRALQMAGMPESETNNYCRFLADAYEAVVNDMQLPSPESYCLSAENAVHEIFLEDERVGHLRLRQVPGNGPQWHQGHSGVLRPESLPSPPRSARRLFRVGSYSGLQIRTWLRFWLTFPARHCSNRRNQFRFPVLLCICSREFLCQCHQGRNWSEPSVPALSDWRCIGIQRNRRNLLPGRPHRNDSLAANPLCTLSLRNCHASFCSVVLSARSRGALRMVILLLSVS